MIYIEQNSEQYNNDLRSMIMAFNSGIKITTKAEDENDCFFKVKADFNRDTTVLLLECWNVEFLQRLNRKTERYSDKVVIKGDYLDKQEFRNSFKMGIYNLLKDFTNIELPWGDLTGVRPTKIAMAKLNEGASIEEAIDNYVNLYGTSNEKASLAVKVAKFEKDIIKSIDSTKEYCLYVGIPFCPSRCLYCSFTSYPIGLYKDKAATYIDYLIEELKFIAKANKDRRLISIYIGGGTPTSISHELLDKLLGGIKSEFDLNFLREYTVEAGRPDSITSKKLEVIKKYNVSRISINPQTMNDDTLELIGRAHNSEQITKAFGLAREIGFDNINMDLIAGLPNEGEKQMATTLKYIKEFNPESLTVHSLAIKRAANLKEQIDKYQDTINQDTNTMLDMVSQCATELNMEPYYLYRQKNIAGNLENVGYSVKGKECLYNILIMEEITDIIAAGAGGSTKLIFHEENRVERVENCKSVDDYINRFDEMIDRKRTYMEEKQ